MFMNLEMMPFESDLEAKALLPVTQNILAVPYRLCWFYVGMLDANAL